MSTQSFVKTDTILDKILARKVEEVTEAQQAIALSRVRAEAEVALPARGFESALRQDTVSLIAEVKKASPSKGVLIENFDPAQLGIIYAENGAAAISVLTDVDFFQGKLDYLRHVRAAVNVPVLRKDFIIDSYQVYEGRAAGADAILLIVAALEDQHMAGLHAQIVELGMSALVEVHNEAEMERALKLGATLIGINNRDLKTFEVDLNTSARVASIVPDNVTLVAESGIRDAEDVVHMGKIGAHAVLVGESLVRTQHIRDDLAGRVREFSSQPRQ
ncbi:MAG: indole-3-glycerol phosphate synthase TrpC [Aggregatilineales bacterium]